MRNVDVGADLAAMIQAGANELVDLAEALINEPSGSPPGDVTGVIRVAEAFLTSWGIEYRRYTASPGRENLVATVRGRGAGKHVVLNAHLDTFPIDPGADVDRTAAPFARREGERLYGRGACDMKGGAAALMVALKALSQRTDTFAGRVSLCLVCDEESFGPDGSKYLLEQVPDLSGDALLSAEPSSTNVVRFGERGIVIGQAVFEGDVGHTAYPTGSENAIIRAAAFMLDLRQVLNGELFSESVTASQLSADSADGSSPNVSMVSLNFGRIRGGIKANMLPRRCELDVDIRLPLGISAPSIRQEIEQAAVRSGGVFTCWESADGSASDTSHWLFDVLRGVAEEVTGKRPSLAVGPGCTDARYWRARSVPAAVFGPNPASTVSDDEYVSVDEMITVAKVHALTCWNVLRYGAGESGTPA